MADFNGAADGGAVATDSIWAAAGDIVYATADDTASVLSVGTNSDILQLSSGIPDWTCAPTLAALTVTGELTISGAGDLTINGNCINLCGATGGQDVNLVDNNAAALSFDSAGKAYILLIDTQNCAEGVTMSGTLGVTGVLTATGGIELSHASQNTLTGSSGCLSVEGNVVYRAGGTDVPLADGGTGASLSDPGADRILFWDDGSCAVAFLTAGTGLTICGTTITAAGGGVPNPFFFA